MLRTILVGCAALAIGATAVVAQTARPATSASPGTSAAANDPIATRKETMKGVGAAARTATQMSKGEAPFDLAKAKAVFNTFENAAKRMPTLFPANSKTGGETTAAPKIWEDMAGFRARFAKFEQDADAAERATRDLASFQAEFTKVSQNCGGCHENYRIKRN
jgi:cytochrome c556